MSHAHGRRASCGLRLLCRRFHSIHRTLAGGVTDVGVGSGALLGVWEITGIYVTAKNRGPARKIRSRADSSNRAKLLGQRKAQRRKALQILLPFLLG